VGTGGGGGAFCFCWACALPETVRTAIMPATRQNDPILKITPTIPFLTSAPFEDPEP
jgi:hypothetical protein